MNKIFEEMHKAGIEPAFDDTGTDAKRPPSPACYAEACASVPVAELAKLEQARIDLWKLSDKLDLSPQQFSQMQSVTGVMWAIANRNWPPA